MKHFWWSSVEDHFGKKAALNNKEEAQQYGRE